MKVAILAFASAALFANGAIAQVPEKSDLTRLKDAGVLKIGVRGSSIPFSFKDSQNNYKGFALDICLKAAEALQARIPGLKVQLIEVDSKSRLPALTDGKIDMECGSTTNSAGRRKTHDFSIPYFFSHLGAMVHSSSNTFSFYDLDADNLFVTTAGTNTTEVLHTNGFKVGYLLKDAGVVKIEGKDHADSFRLFRDKPKAVYFNDDSLLMGLAAKESRPEDFRLLTGIASIEPYGVVTRKGSTLMPVINKTIYDMMKSGQFTALYSKWFLATIQPENFKINLPMSPELKDVVRFPTPEVGN